MRLAIMQPYFLPYIGYFQLLNAVDEFILYDNIQFSKKGWVQRNRILRQGNEQLFSLPLKKDSDYLNINQRFLADSYPKEKIKILRKIKSAYIRAPHFVKVQPIIEACFDFDDWNLFNFIFNSIEIIRNYLQIETNLIISSDININESLSGRDRVISLCKVMKSKKYINAVGGQKLYDKNYFAKFDIDLQFINTKYFSYKQFDNEFVPNLSIIDLMMFNSLDQIKEFLTYYTLI